MLRIETSHSAASRRFRIDGHGAGAWIHPYFGTTRQRDDGTPLAAGDPQPMLYLVAQDASTAIDSHFHQVDQFQVVVRGSGSLGRVQITPWTVHYAGAYTGYGPLQAGPDGLDYLTVRRAWDPGLRPLPQARAELDAIPGRVPVHRIAAASDAVGCVMAPDREAGSGAWFVDLGPGASVQLPGSAACDRFVVIATGSLLCGDVRLGPLDGIFVPARTSPAPTLAVDEGAARCLVLQFSSPLTKGSQ